MSIVQQRCSSSVFSAILFIIAIIDNYMFSYVRITKLCVYTFKFHAFIQDAVNWWLEQTW